MNPTMTRSIACACAVLAMPAMAYIGPGAGLSLVGALWAVIAAVGAALFFVLAWPLRRMLRRRRSESLDEHDEMVGAADARPHPAAMQQHRPDRH
jgi:membrane protein implicated in regulation of membrane protease activity